MGTHILFLRSAGHDQGISHRLVVSLWLLSLIFHARLLFITVLHGDNASPSSMLAGSTAVCTATPGTGLCDHTSSLFHRQEPDEIVFGYKHTPLASNREA